MTKLETRKTLALGFSGAYILLVCLCTMYNLEVPEQFTIIVTTVVAYYFGGETALDIPQWQEKEQK